jgi:hypothetical protein
MKRAFICSVDVNLVDDANSEDWCFVCLSWMMTCDHVLYQSITKETWMIRLQSIFADSTQNDTSILCKSEEIMTPLSAILDSSFGVLYSYTT